ncbi:hypothetical protein M413DRAFT_442253 [Hebeloma cylindrosporum]|uniref:Wax synthase domain-containing protein n=1 Tax=Hebeloma cylindrosporum TaxID=76867 RepID=A0A0C3CNG9_HEBCY|nr:hypothetical protein M413DRAFT_442253 [Hebeloma cylindrosporum h7]
MSACYVIASIIAVATGLYEPRDWPHLFGSPLDAYTVRKCWGRVWHQMHRRTFTSNSNFLANVLHLPRGTVMTYFKLFTFSESKAIQFFVLQAVAITFEDALIAIASRLEYKESKGFKLIGFIWVFAWFAYSAPMYFNHQAQAQGTVEETNNFSLIRMLTSFCVAKLKN